MLERLSDDVLPERRAQVHLLAVFGNVEHESGSSSEVLRRLLLVAGVLNIIWGMRALGRGLGLGLAPKDRSREGCGDSLATWDPHHP